MWYLTGMWTLGHFSDIAPYKHPTLIHFSNHSEAGPTQFRFQQRKLRKSWLLAQRDKGYVPARVDQIRVHLFWYIPDNQDRVSFTHNTLRVLQEYHKCTLETAFAPTHTQTCIWGCAREKCICEVKSNTNDKGFDPFFLISSAWRQLTVSSLEDANKSEL